jgi:cation:H+ antiporter
MWQPRQTPETRIDEPDAEAEQASLWRLWLRFLALGVVVAGCGFAVARAGISLVARTGLSESLVGGLLTSVVTSLPELVTVVVAVRMGALTLAVGDIIGGNTFDVLFVAVADLAYREGSIYAAIGAGPSFLCALTLLLTAILAAGLIHRGKTGIGFEGTAILVVYAVGFVTLSFVG